MHCQEFEIISHEMKELSLFYHIQGRVIFLIASELGYLYTYNFLDESGRKTRNVRTFHQNENYKLSFFN